MTERGDWTQVRFGDVVRLSTERCTDPVAAGIDRYVGLEHLEPSDLRIRSWGNVADGVTFTNRFRPGQVLFGKRRAYQRKVAVAEFDGICSSDIYVFEPADDRLLPGLLPFLCQTDGFFEHALKTSAGSLSPRTNWGSLADYEFDLPELEEQNRIITACKAADNCLNASKYLQSSLHTTLAALGNRHAEILADAPQMTVYELCDPGRPLCYGVVQPGDPNGEVPLLRVCDLTDEGTIASRESLNTITKDVDEQYRRSRVESGDVLVSVVGTIGRVAIIGGEYAGSNIARALARISPIRELMTPEFLAMVFASPEFQTRLVRGAFESARKTLNLSELGQMRVPCPGLAAQREIAQTNALVRAAFFAAANRAVATRESIRRFLLPGQAVTA
jgi:type I restriction enzyme S subunit